MSNMLEIRWHGRGGQGVKTAALLLADIAFYTGRWVQGFPEYGPERMGAPVTAYNRISDKQVRTHSNIYQPGYVALMDESLLRSVSVTHGLASLGMLLINSGKDPETLSQEQGAWDGCVLSIDARAISEEILGTYFPNMPMLAAVVRMTKLLPKEVFLEHMEESLQHKFTTKSHLMEGNMAVLKRAWEDVRGL